jgi:hypothetical protein
VSVVAAGTRAAQGGGPGGAGGTGTAGPGVARGRNGRLLGAIGLLVVLGGILIALLQPGAPVTGYLDPGNTGATGSHALADLLAQRGIRVTKETSTDGAVAAARAGGSPGSTTVLVTSPSQISRGGLRSLAGVPANLMVVAPDLAALDLLAPGVSPAGMGIVQRLAPDCPLAAARLAGAADVGGIRMFSPARQAVRCYPVGGLPTLLVFSGRGRTVTLLGSGRSLTNANLDRAGNAALNLNLLRTQQRVIWLVPPPGTLSRGQPKSLTSLIPRPAYLVAIELAIAALLAAMWRGRRLGPLVTESLPVTIRAAETVEGHARLYQARRARDRAASELRSAVIRRIAPLLGLPPTAAPEAIVTAAAARSSRPVDEVSALLAGPVPAGDAELAELAGRLDALEKEVRTQ